MDVSKFIVTSAIIVTAGTGDVLSSSGDLDAAQADHHGTHGQANHAQKAPDIKKLLPADGASIKIISPKKQQIFQTDQIPLQFKLVKGKRGHHVHAYVDGELSGMFNSQTGTLTGIKPGKHVLELRVVAEDHQSELDAVDTVSFTVR